MPFDLPLGGREPIEIRVLDALARGLDTVPALAAELQDPPEVVDRAVGWAVANRLATRTLLPSGEHVALTERGIVNVGVQRRLSSMIGPDGEIDVARVGAEIGRSWQAMQDGRAAEAAEAAEAAAHAPVDDAERAATVAALRDHHYAQGAISLPELERRTQLALTAHDRGDLDAALADLQPVAPTAFPAPGGPPAPMAVVGRGMSLETARRIRTVIGVGALVMFGVPMLLALVAVLIGVVGALAD